MILGIISDIHSNPSILETVLAENSEVDQWICVGDFVGLLPLVNDTIDLLLTHKVICIQGDHEESIIKNKELEKAISGNQVISLQQKILTPSHRSWIELLPVTQILHIDSHTFLLKHTITGPSYEKKYSMNIEQLEKEYQLIDVVLFGHTHMPFYWEGEKTIFLNPGSLGFPVSKNKQATYAILDTKTLTSRFFWVHINKETCILSLKQHNYPDRIIELIYERIL